MLAIDHLDVAEPETAQAAPSRALVYARMPKSTYRAVLRRLSGRCKPASFAGVEQTN